MSVYVITHKNVDQINIEGYKYLYVGAYKSKERNGLFIYDDNGDNISDKNSNYCELTGLYWIWKNSKEKYNGLCHYRRFFTKKSISTNKRFFYSESELTHLLNEQDILVAERSYVAEKNIYEHYCTRHYKKDIDILAQLIKNEYPLYLESFDRAMSLKYFFPCNMMYAKKEVLDDYCEWLFELLNKLEQKVDISDYNSMQSRIFGFVSERLLLVWIIANDVKYKEVSVVQIDSSLKHRIRLKLDKVFKTALREGEVYEK